MTQSVWENRRKKASWALDTTRMAKSGYAPRKAELAEWVIEACDEIERLTEHLDRLDSYVRVMRSCQKSQDDPSLTRNEQFALHGQNTVLEMVEGVLAVAAPPEEQRR